jgi:hypothetical protein
MNPQKNQPALRRAQWWPILAQVERPLHNLQKNTRRLHFSSKLLLKKLLV